MPAASTSAASRPPLLTPRSASAVRARMPPSPRLSARITTTTYFSVTTMISAQTIRERMPMTPAWVTSPVSAMQICMV